MYYRSMARIFAVIILLISALYMPFWMTAFLAVAGMFYFSVFIEALIVFVISDLVFGMREVKFSGAVFITIAIGAVLLAGIEFIKKKMKFYKER